jgi:hypothetical protein
MQPPPAASTIWLMANQVHVPDHHPRHDELAKQLTDHLAQHVAHANTTADYGGHDSDSGVLEKNRPDGYGKPSDDQPNLPNPQPVKVPGNVTRPRK